MNTQTINIEETIFCNSVKAVISELKCANRFLSGEVPVTVSNVQVLDVVSRVLDQAKVMADGFSCVFDSSHYCRRFHAIQQVVFKLIYKGSFSLTVQNIQSVISVLEAYLKPVAKPEFKQVELFDNFVPVAPEGLSGYSIDGYLFTSLTVSRLNRLGIFTFDQLFNYTQSDLFSDLVNKAAVTRRSANRVIKDIQDSLDMRGFPNMRVS